MYSYLCLTASVCSGRQADGEKIYLLLELFKRSDAKHMFTETRPYLITVPVYTNLLRYFIHENHNACLIHQCQFCHIYYKKSLKGFVPSSCVNCGIMEVLWLLESPLTLEEKFAFVIASALGSTYEWPCLTCLPIVYGGSDVVRYSLPLAVSLFSFLLIWMCEEILKEAVIN